MPKENKVLTDEQKNFIAVASGKLRELYDYLNKGEINKFVREINLSDNSGIIPEKERKLSLDFLAGQIAEAEKIANTDQFYDWFNNLTSLEKDLHIFEKKILNEIDHDFQVEYNIRYRRNTEIKDAYEKKTMDDLLDYYLKDIAQREAKKEELTILEYSLKEETFFKNYEVLSSYRHVLNGYLDAKKNTPYFQNIEKRRLYNDYNYTMSRNPEYGLSARLNQYHDALDSLEEQDPSDEWKAMKRAMDQALAALKDYSSGNSQDPFQARRKMASAMSLLALTARNYVEHKVNGKDGRRYVTANRVATFAKKVSEKLESDLVELDIQDYISSDGYAARKAYYNEKNNPILGQVRRLKALSDELTEIEGKSHRTSSQYKNLKKKLDQFISADKPPLKDLLDDEVINDPARAEQVWNRYWFEIQNIMDLSEKYLDHKKLQNDGSEGSLLRMDAVLRLKAYLWNIKDAENAYLSVKNRAVSVEEKPEKEQNQQQIQVQPKEEEEKPVDLDEENRKAYAAHIQDCKNDILEKVRNLKRNEFDKVKDSILLECYEIYVNDVANHVFNRDIPIDPESEKYLEAVKSGNGTEFARKLMEEDKKNPDTARAQILSADNLDPETTDLLRHTGDNAYDVWNGIYKGEMLSEVQKRKAKRNVDALKDKYNEALNDLKKKLAGKISPEDFNKVKSDIIHDCCTIYGYRYYVHAVNTVDSNKIKEEARSSYKTIIELVEKRNPDQLIEKVKKGAEDEETVTYDWFSEKMITADCVRTLISNPVRVCTLIRLSYSIEEAQAKLLEEQNAKEEKERRAAEEKKQEELRKADEKRQEELRRQQEAVKKEEEERAAREKAERDAKEAPMRNAGQLKINSYKAQKKLKELLRMGDEHEVSDDNFKLSPDMKREAAKLCHQIYLSNLYDFAKERQLQKKEIGDDRMVILHVEQGITKEYLDILWSKDYGNLNTDSKSAFYEWFNFDKIDLNTAKAMADPVLGKEISKKVDAGLKTPAFYLNSYKHDQEKADDLLTGVLVDETEREFNYNKERYKTILQDYLYAVYADSLYRLAKSRQGTDQATFEDFVRINLMETGRRDELIKQIKENDKTVGELFDLEKLTFRDAYRAYKEGDIFATEVDKINDALLHPKMEEPKLAPEKKEAKDPLPGEIAPAPREIAYSRQAEEDIAQSLLSEEELAQIEEAKDNEKQFLTRRDQAADSLKAAIAEEEKWRSQSKEIAQADHFTTETAGKLPDDVYCRIYAARMYAQAKENEAAGKASQEELRRIRLVESGMGEKWIAELMKAENSERYIFDKHNFDFENAQKMADPESVSAQVGKIAGEIEPIISNVQQFRQITEKTRRELKNSGLAESVEMFDYLKEGNLKTDDLYQIYAGDFYTMVTQTPFNKRTALQRMVVDYVNTGKGKELISFLKEGNNINLWLSEDTVVFETVKRLADPFESMVLAQDIFSAKKAPAAPKAKPEEGTYKGMSDEEFNRIIEEDQAAQDQAAQEETARENAQAGSGQLSPKARVQNAEALKNSRIVAINALSAIMDRGMGYMKEHKAALHPDTFYHIYAADLYENAVEQREKDLKSGQNTLTQDQLDCIELVETGRAREFINILKNQTRPEQYALDTKNVKWKTALAMAQPEYTKKMSLVIAENSKPAEKAGLPREKTAGPKKEQNENVESFISQVEDRRAYLADLIENKTPEVFNEDRKDLAGYASECLYQVYVSNLYKLAKEHQADKKASWKENDLVAQIESGRYYMVIQELKADDEAALYQFAPAKISYDTVAAMSDTKSNMAFTLRLQEDNRSINAFLTGKAAGFADRKRGSGSREINRYIKSVLVNLKDALAGKTEYSMSKSDTAFTIYAAYLYTEHARAAKENPEGYSAKLVNSIKDKDYFIKYVEKTKQNDKIAGKLFNDPDDKLLAELAKPAGIRTVAKAIAKTKAAGAAGRKKINEPEKKGPVKENKVIGK